MSSRLIENGWGVQELAIPSSSQVFSKIFSDHRVDVLVPADLSPSTPVLVMHDGKNLFWDEQSSFGNSWGVVGAVESSADKPVVIGIWGLVNPDFPAVRMFELAPQQALEEQPKLWGEILQFAKTEQHEAFADKYHAMIADQIIPEVVHLLNIDLAPERTALAGSSMGGITSLYAASIYPLLYGTVLSLSTHWAYWDPEIIPAVINRISTEPRTRIWIDRGDLELDAMYEGLHERAAELLRSRGWQDGHELQAHVFEGTNHSEPAWRERLPQILNWWLN